MGKPIHYFSGAMLAFAMCMFGGQLCLNLRQDANPFP